MPAGTEEPLPGMVQFLGRDSQPASVALHPTPQAFFVDQSAHAIPGKCTNHRAQQTGQHHQYEVELALADIKTSQRHDDLRRDRRDYIFQHHRGKDSGVTPLLHELFHHGIQGAQQCHGRGCR
jgi:hypothetical protein